MVTTTNAFASMSVDDLDAARRFYGETLGFAVHEIPQGLMITVNDATVFAYPKPDHSPAAYTALNLEVPDLDAAVAELNAAGVLMLRYPGMEHDEVGIVRGGIQGGPDIAWFADPAGNVIALMPSRG